MVIDTFASSPDMLLAMHDNATMMAGHTLDNVSILAQTTTIGEDASGAPKLGIEVSDNVAKTIRIIGVALGLAWVLYAGWNFGKPGGTRQATQKMGGVVGIIVALTAIVSMLDINTTFDVADKLLQIGWFVLTTLKNAF